MHEKTGMARSRLPVAHRKRKQRKTLNGAKLVKGFMKILERKAYTFPISHFISCSSLSKTGAVKNSLSVISRPSQSFLIVVMEISRRFGSSILYTVDGVTPGKNRQFVDSDIALETEFTKALCNCVFNHHHVHHL